MEDVSQDHLDDVANLRLVEVELDAVATALGPACRRRRPRGRLLTSNNLRLELGLGRLGRRHRRGTGLC